MMIWEVHELEPSSLKLMYQRIECYEGPKKVL
jgi:hypothetical protein